MKKTFIIFLVFCPVIFSCETSRTAGPGHEQEVVLWYDTPASDWNRALPVGNGRLGAMVFGDPSLEHLQLNEESVWCRKGKYEDPDGSVVIPEIRRLLFDGKYREAEDLAVRDLLRPQLHSGTNSYQTLGDLRIRYPGVSEVTGYRRELRLDSALVRVVFGHDGSHFRRTIFSSAVDSMIVFREQCQGTALINCVIGLDRPGEGEEVIAGGRGITMRQHVEDGHGVKYEARLEVLTEEGNIEPDGKELVVSNARAMELRFWAFTDYSGADPAELCDKVGRRSESRTYGEILSDHEQEYQGWFNRVSLDLGHLAASELPTDERIAKSGEGELDPGLAELYFNFGRYLLISSSRPGNLPANLQGIWARELIPPWNADYHININIQMNYWPSEVTNLSECHLPFLYFLGELRESGSKTARTTYNARGFVAHHTTDAWHQTQLFGAPYWGMWPMGAAWASTHIWEHFLFTGDTAFLADYGYGVMREAALFMTDFLVEHPVTGKLVTGPSISPENRFVTPSGDTASLNMGPSMDLEIVWHLFTACIRASEVLTTDTVFRNELQTCLDRLAPVRIGTDGRILEWSDEGLTEAEPGHRHMSHLYGLYPSSQFTWSDTPEYMEAARKVIETRLEHGGGHTGWSRAWMINFFARLKDGEQVAYHLQQLLARSTLPNLFDNHPPFQIDGNFGGTAGIAECLLQSHAGYVEFLPALPPPWKEGSVKGLVARGGFLVEMEWKEGELVQARIFSRLGNELVIRYGEAELKLHPDRGSTVVLDGGLRPV
jgi:alpha-L-fucosidase 2